MTLEEMKKKREERSYSYSMLSNFAGIPIPTIQKIFHGDTKSPRYDTLLALERAFNRADSIHDSVIHYDEKRIRKTNAAITGDDAFHDRFVRQGLYTLEDYRTLPDQCEVELIDGFFYDMHSPRVLHQLIVGELFRQIANFTLTSEIQYTALMAPVDVQLGPNEPTMIHPDILIVCDPEKVQKQCIFGAPDFVLEVISPSTQRKDFIIKLHKYESAGVREYWILDPYQEKLLIYDFSRTDIPAIHDLDRPIPVNTTAGALSIDPKYIAKWLHTK